MNDAFTIANALDDAARAIHDRLVRDWSRLTPSQRDLLERMFREVIAAAIRVRTFGVDGLLDGANTSVAELADLTADARDKIKTLNDVRRAIDVVTALFSLAVAISTAVAAPNPASIVAAAQSLKTVVDKVSAEPALAGQ